MTLEFLDESVVRTRERALCTVVLSHPKRHIGEMIIKGLCKCISKNQKTEVNVDVQTDMETSPSTEQNKKEKENKIRQDKPNTLPGNSFISEGRWIFWFRLFIILSASP